VEGLQEQGDWRGSDRLLALVPSRLRADERIRALGLRPHLYRGSVCIDRLDVRCLEREIGRAKDAGFGEADLTALRRKADEVAGALVRARWAEIRGRRSLDERISSCRNIRVPLELEFQERAGTGGRIEVSAEQVARTCQSLEDAGEREIARREEAARRAKEAAIRRWQYAPLRCRDGTLSPSCICGQGSKRGCCSHHGGVAGCSQEYPGSG
jgi:hypothetical protein